MKLTSSWLELIMINILSMALFKALAVSNFTWVALPKFSFMEQDEITIEILYFIPASRTGPNGIGSMAVNTNRD